MRAFKAYLDTLLLLECDFKQHSQLAWGNDTPVSQQRLAKGKEQARKMLTSWACFLRQQACP